MATQRRKTPGMRERSPGVWELIVEVGRDPLTGKRRQASRLFHGNLRDAKKERIRLLGDVDQGTHDGTNARLDELFGEWIKELERKGRSPNTIHNCCGLCDGGGDELDRGDGLIG
ncbi:MAG: hypothetical protein GY926_12460 [bacterium]|nr:hypothetical protein [bacterium]